MLKEAFLKMCYSLAVSLLESSGEAQGKTIVLSFLTTLTLLPTPVLSQDPGDLL